MPKTQRRRDLKLAKLAKIKTLAATAFVFLPGGIALAQSTISGPIRASTVAKRVQDSGLCEAALSSERWKVADILPGRSVVSWREADSKVPDISLPFTFAFPFQPIIGSEIPPTDADSIDFQKVIEAITFANARFSRRGWSEGFLGERIKVAKKFARSSRYFLVRSVENGPGTDEIVGSVGMTVSRSAEDPLPMAFSHGWKLSYPARGPIIELRSYAMKEGNQLAAFPLLFSWCVKNIHDAIEGVPGLPGQEIIYTYGDETSIRMYRLMGFRLADPAIFPPIDHMGTRWYVLTASPERFVENYRRMKNFSLGIRGSGGAFNVIGADGRRLPVRAVYLNKSGLVVHAITAQNFELWPGAEVLAGQHLDFSSGGDLVRVSKFAKPVEVSPGIFADNGSWYEDLSLREAGHIHANAVIADGRIVAQQGSGIQLFRSGFPRFINTLARSFEVLPGVWAQKGTRFGFPFDYGKEDQLQNVLSFTLGKKTELRSGVWANRGDKLMIRVLDRHTYEIIEIERGDQVQRNPRYPYPSVTRWQAFNRTVIDSLGLIEPKRVAEDLRAFLPLQLRDSE